MQTKGCDAGVYAMKTWKFLAMVTAVAMVGMLWSTEAQAQRSAEVPVQVGIGPAGYLLGGPSIDEFGWEGRLFDDQPIHTGLRLSLTAVIDSELVEEHPGMVPRQYRSEIQDMGEVRYAPGILSVIPTDIYLSPEVNNTQIWGATWTGLSLGAALPLDEVRISASGSLIGTFKYIRSDVLPEEHYIFARPGVELAVDFEVPIDERFLMSVGWTSKVYVPQDLDGNVGDVGEIDGDSLWHVGSFYLQGHFRFPYTHRY